MIKYEIRQRIVAAHKRGVAVKELVEAYGYQKTAIYRLIAQERETGEIAPKTNTRGRKSTVSDDEYVLIGKAIDNQPDITLEEIKERLNLHIGVSRLCRIVKHKLNYTYKKRWFMRQKESVRM